MVERIEIILALFCDRRPIWWAYLAQPLGKGFVLDPRVVAIEYKRQYLEACLKARAKNGSTP